LAKSLACIPHHIADLHPREMARDAQALQKAARASAARREALNRQAWLEVLVHIYHSSWCGTNQ